ncbi:MAG: hypothetical protein HC907_33985 [Richelia sp. SM1_7_0]|nr:hypothetical protein [Richelia sp. SM1_7_0]
MRLKIAGDVLQSTHKTWLEKRESWTRIQNIDSVEIMEAPIYPLLAIGSFLSFLGLRGLFDVNIFLLFLLFLGISLILFAILKKRRYLAVMSHRNTIAVFMNKPPEVYQQFAMNLMLISRQLNALLIRKVKIANLILKLLDRYIFT